MKRFALVAVSLVLVGALALAWFEPWRIWTSSTIDEAEPTVSATPSPAADVSAAPRASSTPTPQPTAPEVLAAGRFVDGEHHTTGRARVLTYADGRRFVRLERFDTSDGPDVAVWLSDQPAGGAWGSFDDGRYVKLGKLKATSGNQNYVIPPGVDLAGIRSVVIWCVRFHVAFGSAAVDLA